MASVRFSKEWLLVGGSFLALSIIFSARATLGLAMPHVEAETGWNRSFMSAVMSATLIFMAVMAPVAGRLIDRIGPRIVLLAGTAAVIVGSRPVRQLGSSFSFQSSQRSLRLLAGATPSGSMPRLQPEFL